MSHTFRSKDHTDLKSGDEIEYIFHHDQGLSSGGYVTIMAFNESKQSLAPGSKEIMIPEKLGELQVHKDALIAFVAAMVHNARVSQLEDMNDLQVLGL